MAKTVALLVGGWSAERQVSLDKGKHVEQALKDAGYAVRVIDVKKDLDSFREALTPKPDIVFNNLYGRGGEDGTIQGVLDMMGIPYTHSGVLASAIAMDKVMTKRLVRTLDIPTPEWAELALSDVASNNTVPMPYVIKPVNEGSSVGVYIIEESGNVRLDDIADKQLGEKVMVEQFIPGRELTVAVLDAEPQAVTEIKASAPFFDYDAKYSDQKTEYILPADIPLDVYNKALDYAAQIFKLLKCQGLARCDFRYNDTAVGAKGLYFLEINTQPGLTAESIGPSQVIYNGTSFPELCAHLVETAQCQFENKTKSQDPKNPPLNDGGDSRALTQTAS